MNQNFTLSSFAEPITGLPDTPTCAADELKRRFQAPADEVREAHNALAEAHETLDEKVEGIVTQTFAGAIHESMFDEELAEKLNSKADEASVSERLTAEQTARKSADSALTEAQTALSTAVAQKCEVYIGSYVGDGTADRHIKLGFTPDALILCRQNYDGDHRCASLALNGFPGGSPVNCKIEASGFRVYTQNAMTYTNVSDITYLYLAFRFTLV